MIERIKIYGERNSGTNFLEELLRSNCEKINILKTKYNCHSGWKHGFPDISKYKIKSNILFVFIIRDLESWLKSMFKNPYHFIPNDDILEFIKKPVIRNDNPVKHDVMVNKFERQSLMKIRYAKIKSYLKFYHNIKHGIFINLENIQKDGGKHFINFLNKNYKIKIKNDFTQITKHSKNNKNIKNRTYNIILPEKYIKNNKINKVENFITHLKTKYIYK